MTDWFTPTAGNYFGRISKAGIELALAEAKGRDVASGVAGMKKAEAAAYAERVIAETGWHPSAIRITALETLDGDSKPFDQDDEDGDTDGGPQDELVEAAE
ncbi:hypothetical protein [Rhizobium jaguaris]|uniref:Uncharacterized protein n=1 Tax=Rhizobium jaguaris TaxID=1312183 RepID=A0A387G8P5_9HYPH|nr:hypothetical protein [Rhizobium jaguaris]AYG64534.1 hypothetical protein CCGE525_38145 [Rhizobium jaguaris]